MFNKMKFIQMEGQKKRFVRFQNPMHPDDPTLEVESGLLVNLKKRTSTTNIPNGLNNKVDKVEDKGYEKVREGILDPTGEAWNKWNGVFLYSCLAALFIDPLFFYLPVVDDSLVCLKIDTRLAIIITVLRTMTDIFHLVHIAVSFRTGYIVTTSESLGRGNLVDDPWAIAKRYLSRHFILDFVAVLPLPQIVIWAVIPHLQGTTADNTKNALRFIILIQLIPRVYPLIQQLGKTSKIVTETAWAGAAYNLLLYMLISHFFGACYYLLAVERIDTCWRQGCTDGCDPSFFDCSIDRNAYQWNTTDLQLNCSADNDDFFDFGIYNDSIGNGIISTNKFVDKYFYCLWFGLRNLSTLGQGLQTSSYDGELIFSIIIVIFGLTLFAQLLGKMQTYLQSLTVRLEEMRLKRQDMEQWMQHRQLGPELRERIRNYEQYKWLETRGVNEEEVVRVLPKDLRRDIKRHLCLYLVKQVDLFASMDGQLLDAICERLQPTLFTPGTNVMEEGDRVSEMLFIVWGQLKSVTKSGGKVGSVTVGRLKPGLFCGEELLPWALDPKSGEILPYSASTVTAETEVEAFALKAEDLKFVATRFRRLHSKQLQHTFRHYSQKWRIWAACSIQAAWRRYVGRKLEEARRREEASLRAPPSLAGHSHGNASFGAALLVSRFAVNAMRSVHRLRGVHAAQQRLSSLKLQKPAEPDFSAEETD